MDENEWIDINLKNVAVKQYGKVKFINRKGQSANNYQAEAVIMKLREERLADLTLTGGELMERGEMIISKYGGWMEWKVAEKKINKRLELKEKFSFHTAKWKYYTFWIWFVIAILGGAYSIYDFIERLSTSENDQQKQIPTKESQIEAAKSHTLILDQKKS